MEVYLSRPSVASDSMCDCLFDSLKTKEEGEMSRPCCWQGHPNCEENHEMKPDDSQQLYYGSLDADDIGRETVLRFAYGDKCMKEPDEQKSLECCGCGADESGKQIYFCDKHKERPMPDKPKQQKQRAIRISPITRLSDVQHDYSNVPRFGDSVDEGICIMCGSHA
jgi:hypothetical protein